jgi:Rod binding domain-containing protein
MDTGLDIMGQAQAALANQAPTATRSFKDAAAMDKAAKEFESVFISQFLGSMFAGIKTDGPFGGGQGEEMFRSMMINKYADGIAAQGGFGLAANVKAQMLKMQEAQP